MFKPLAYSLMIAATLGLAACDNKAEQKAQDAQQHAEKAADKMDAAQENMQQAAEHDAKAKDAATAAHKAQAEESQKFVPDSTVPKSIDSPEKK